MFRHLLPIFVTTIVSLGYGYSQESKLPEKVSLLAENISFEEAIGLLRQNYSISFFYSASRIPVHQKVSIKAENESLSIVIANLCNQIGASFFIQGNQIVIRPKTYNADNTKNSISGYVTDSLTGERLIGASIIFGEDKGTSTNSYGYYSYAIPPGVYTVKCYYIGYKTMERSVEIVGDCSYNIVLMPASLQLKEVRLRSSGAKRGSSTGLGVEILPLPMVKSYPALLGENDIIQFLKMMPGVQTTTDGVNGLFVRGSTPQNTTFLIDDAPMFNMYHISGWFSTINPDAVKEVSLYKSHLPLNSGGGLSSLIDIRLRDGNNQNFAVTGGLGTITSRLTLEGPIVRDRSSFIVSARRSYIDKLIKAFNLENDVELGDVYFYDINAKLNYTLNYRNRLYLSAYMGNDHVNETEGTIWGNSLLSFRWNHLFSQNLFSNLCVTGSRYQHGFNGIASDSAKYQIAINLINYTAKYDLSYYTPGNNRINFGMSTNVQVMPPTSYKGIKMVMPLDDKLRGSQRQTQGNLYCQVEHNLTERLLLDAGIRLTLLLRDLNGEHFRRVFPVPSIQIKFKATGRSSVKVGFSRSNQFVHGVNPFGLIIPFERYYFADNNLKPQYANHFSAGFAFTNQEKLIELCIEPYFSMLRNQYRFPANMEMLTETTPGTKPIEVKSNSYGVEFSTRKQTGRLRGLVSYTWARIDKQDHTINQGRFFNPYYDRRHDLVINATYRLWPRVDLSATWVYMGGTPYSLPAGKYEIRGRTIPLFDENNLYNYRMPDYHRLDLSITFNFRETRHYRHSLSLTVYNAYAQKNSIFFTYRDVVDGNLDNNPNGKYTSKEFSMLGYYFFNILPAFSYEFKFK